MENTMANAHILFHLHPCFRLVGKQDDCSRQRETTKTRSRMLPLKSIKCQGQFLIIMSQDVAQMRPRSKNPGFSPSCLPHMAIVPVHRAYGC